MYMKIYNLKILNMNRQTIKIAFVIFFTLILSLVKGQKPSEYKLVWEENFDNPTLNNNIWTAENNNKGGGNAEAQFYIPQNLGIEKHPSGVNCLVLTAQRKTYKGRPAISGRVNTEGKLTVKYGKIDVRVLVPKTANGLWPAFWMLGDDKTQVGWPRCGEIDIVELGNWKGIEENLQDRYFNGALHWGDGWNDGKYPNKGMHSAASYSLQDEFQLFTLIWTPDSILMFLNQDKYPDAKPYFDMRINEKENANSPGWFFHKPYHILANLAVGGTFTGLPYYPRKFNIFPSWNKNFRKITALPKNGKPVKMYIDYIKIYQNGTPGEELNIINPKP